MEPNTPQKPMYQPPAKPKVSMPLVFVIITLSVIATTLGILYFRSINQLGDTKEEVLFVEEQKQKLEGELNNLIFAYDSLKTENDSINTKLAGEQQKIKKLLGYQASNAQKIRMYQNELETLRKVMRSYIVQIDSLNTRNRELTEENVKVRTQLRRTETDYKKLSDVKEELSSKVEFAQKLSAKNIIPMGLNDRSKEKDKIDKIAKLRICFTVRENRVADAGKKMIYLQLIRPDNIILSSPESGTTEFEGEQIVYSAKRELEYDNMDIDMCIFWDKTEELIPGEYTIKLFCEGFEIGVSSLILK
ncbi:MAG: hypothetical protein JXA77_00785 [Bacteroidales bacterium]|nr:hypothetical protein [Bacteroidales bacterium]MBN2820796.1 hypothetical protein [Bacteroidales bacterium]